ncbi:MAG: Z1 domain-containing protein [Reyranella sp.]|nr:Z1 domain-containing protein [Parvibaculum sp.]MCF8533582.1 Z1 domain-containing protein [Reyranella sp.]
MATKPEESTTAPQRQIIRDGLHTAEALSVLGNEIKAPESLHAIAERAAHLLGYAVDPIAGPVEPSYGLLYGLIQSGKTSVITITTAMAADNGFKCVVILTSDLNPLYSQTLRRIRSQLRGLKVFGKSDWDTPAFERQVRTSPFVIVCSKNPNHLASLLDAFKKVGSAGARGLPTMIIDDEADQASLNTHTQKNAKKNSVDISKINELISNFRGFFQTNTYLQVTATPQALFLQRPDGSYRPSFTVLSEPGPGYVGGEAFFEDNSKLLRFVDIDEVDELKSGHQPSPTHRIPDGLKEALLSFWIAAAARNIQFPEENFSFLCHISHTKIDHKHIVGLIDKFREDAVNAFADRTSTAFQKLEIELLAEHRDLAGTEPALPPFAKILDRIAFLLPAASIKEINSNSNEEITPDHVYSIFVGGNKLGRGVTIPNLITSYYGRNPKRPNSDTVLQHARMYGYRQSHIGVTRLFLPDKLAEHFRIIHQMEKALRALVGKHPQGQFEGIYLASPLQATRRNVLDPNAIGVYVAGGWINPRYILRTPAVTEATKWLDEQLAKYDGQEEYYQTDVASVRALIEKCVADPAQGTELWNTKTIGAALEKLETLSGQKAYIRVQRDRALEATRRETQGHYSGGEDDLVPSDAVTLFMFRIRKSNRGEVAWLPQVRFPDGNYAIAFSFDN